MAARKLARAFFVLPARADEGDVGHRRHLRPDQFFEGVLEDLRGAALEQDALVAADLPAQVNELVA